MRSSRHIYGKLGGAHPSRIRALSPAAWFQPGVGVTGSLTASNWADQSGNGRDLAQGTAGNQPINLPHTGTDYAYLPGVVSNNFSTPDAAANRITGDIDIRAYVALNDWTPAAQQILVSKFNTGDARAYELRVHTDGKLILGWTPGSDAQILGATSTVATGVTDAAAKWVRATLDVDNGASGYTATFYTSDDGSTWTVLGTAVTGVGVTSIANGSDPVRIGERPSGTSYVLGKVYRAQIYNGIDGTLAVDFNPSTFAETSTNGATAVASTGETWTLNSTGAKPAQIVKSASLLFDGADDYLKTAAFTLNQPTTIYLVGKQISNTGADTIFDGDSFNTQRLLQGTSPEVSIYANGAGNVTSNGGWAIGAKAIVMTLFNGASSLIQVNAATATTETVTNGSAGGIELGGGSGTATCANIQVWELIAFSAAHTAAQRASVQAYLSARHGVAL